MIAFYAAGLGCVPLQANEFFPVDIRAIRTMIIDLFNWESNILSIIEGISPSGTFGFYLLCFLGCSLCDLLLP
jgi:SP family myo-inositol transporter-like MFS transporter 13